jgi:hypothetical protein
MLRKPVRIRRTLRKPPPPNKSLLTSLQWRVTWRFLTFRFLKVLRMPALFSFYCIQHTYLYTEHSLRAPVLSILLSFTENSSVSLFPWFRREWEAWSCSKVPRFSEETGKTSKSACSFRGMENGEEAWWCRKTSGIQEFLPVLPAVLASCLFSLTEPCRSGRLRKHRYRNAAKPMGKKTAN